MNMPPRRACPRPRFVFDLLQIEARELKQLSLCRPSLMSAIEVGLASSIPHTMMNLPLRGGGFNSDISRAIPDIHARWRDLP